MLRFTLAALARNPKFSLLATVTLAGGIVLTTVCFAVLESAVLRAIPYKEPSRLVLVMKSPRRVSESYWRLSTADFEVLRQESRVFEAIGYESHARLVVRGLPIGPTAAMVARVSPALIETLRLRTVLGRLIRREEYTAAGQGVAIVSFGFWTTAFASDRGVVGRSVTIDGKDYTIVGVAPREIRHPVNVSDLWIPDALPGAELDPAAVSDKLVIGRLRQGVSMEQALQQIDVLRPAVGLVSGGHAQEGERFVLLSLVDQLVGQASRILHLLLAACLAIQVLACLNVGHLLLARRMARARDLGIQLALGCSRLRLCAQVFAESLSVALAAVAVSVPIVLLMLPATSAVASIAIRSEIHAILSIQVLVFSAAIGIASAVVCSVVPVLVLLRLEAATLIHQRWDIRGLAWNAVRVQDALVILQLAAAVCVMAGFGHLTKSVYQLSAVSLGFEPAGLSYWMFDAGTMGFPESARKVEEVIETLGRLPAVRSVAAGSTPLLTGASMRLSLSVQTDQGDWHRIPPVPMQSVSAGYFSTMGIPLAQGRAFNGSDVKGAPCVAIVNRSFARLVWPGTSAVGKRIDIGGGTCEIVGVSGDSRDMLISSPPEPAVFFSHLQRPGSGHLIILVRAAGGAPVSLETVRGAMAAADPSRRWDFTSDVGALVATAIKPSETRAKLFGGLAAIALLLAAVGMYSAASFNLHQRASEFGVRTALGSSPRQLVFFVYCHYGKLVAAGGMVGALASAWLTQLAAAGLPLFEAKAFDPAIFAAAPLVCATVVLAAILVPTRSASRANPSALLRIN